MGPESQFWRVLGDSSLVQTKIGICFPPCCEQSPGLCHPHLPETAPAQGSVLIYLQMPNTTFLLKTQSVQPGSHLSSPLTTLEFHGNTPNPTPDCSTAQSSSLDGTDLIESTTEALKPQKSPFVSLQQAGFLGRDDCPALHQTPGAAKKSSSENPADMPWRSAWIREPR